MDCFGMDAPSVENCRVLEIGCSMGNNLLVMGQDHPKSQFLGIDVSSRQIAEGWKTIEQIGLRNIQLKHMDMLDFGEDFGQFDYIISQGVFSWVPPRAQNKMLEICQRHLAPKGVAYISDCLSVRTATECTLQKRLKNELHNSPGSSRTRHQSIAC